MDEYSGIYQAGSGNRRRNGVAVGFDPLKGKGSHSFLSYGERHTIVPDKTDLRTGTLKSMIKALGLENEF